MGQIEAKCCRSQEEKAADMAAEVEGDEPPAADTAKVGESVAASADVEQPEIETVEAAPAPDPDAPLTDGDITLVEQTWSLVAEPGIETLGVLLFRNIFAIDLEALELFPFKSEPDVFESPLLKEHATKVVTTLGKAVAGLRHIDTLTPELTSLATSHQPFPYLPEHYDVLGQALPETLKASLKDDFTAAVEVAWKKVYKIIAATMTSDDVYKAKAEVEAAAEAPKEEKAPEEAPAAEIDTKKSNDKDAAKKKDEEQMKKKTKPAAKKKKSSDDDAKKKKADAEAKKKAEEETKAADAIARQESAPAADADAEKKKRNKEIKDNWKSVPDAEKNERGGKLRMAAKAGKSAEVQNMLENGVSPDAADGDGWTGLHFAAQEGKKEVIEVLLDFEADPTLLIKLGEWGHTPLHWAAKNDHREIAELLVAADKKGKALRTKNWKGKTPHQLAKGKMASWLKGLAKSA